MIYIIGCAQGIISLHLMSTTWCVYIKYQQVSLVLQPQYWLLQPQTWFGWDLVSTGTLHATKMIQYQTANLWHSWWGGVEWLHQVSTGWIGAETTKADWSFCTIRWRWQCVVVINGNVWRFMNQSNWSPTSAEAQLKRIPPEISELFLKQNLMHVQCFKNRWFHFSIYSPPLVVIGLSNIWSLHWIV